jgi:hypothetical protein
MGVDPPPHPYTAVVVAGAYVPALCPLADESLYETVPLPCITVAPVERVISVGSDGDDTN